MSAGSKTRPVFLFIAPTHLPYYIPFTIDEAGYADILKQVRDHAFEEALLERLRVAN